MSRLPQVPRTSKKGKPQRHGDKIRSNTTAIYNKDSLTGLLVQHDLVCLPFQRHSMQSPLDVNDLQVPTSAFSYPAMHQISLDIKIL